jgi:hypothetical protein
VRADSYSDPDGITNCTSDAGTDRQSDDVALCSTDADTNDVPHL